MDNPYRSCELTSVRPRWRYDPLTPAPAPLKNLELSVIDGVLRLAERAVITLPVGAAAAGIAIGETVVLLAPSLHPY